MGVESVAAPEFSALRCLFTLRRVAGALSGVSVPSSLTVTWEDWLCGCLFRVFVSVRPGPQHLFEDALLFRRLPLSPGSQCDGLTSSNRVAPFASARHARMLAWSLALSGGSSTFLLIGALVP